MSGVDSFIKLNGMKKTTIASMNRLMIKKDRLRCSLRGRYFFFLKNRATPEIYPLPLHDALPISRCPGARARLIYRTRRWGAVCRMRQLVSAEKIGDAGGTFEAQQRALDAEPEGAACVADLFRDRKSTRLNSSHSQISYAVFCLKK